MSDLTAAARPAITVREAVIAGFLVAHNSNYLHEFTHDGRHLFAAQCH